MSHPPTMKAAAAPGRLGARIELGPVVACLLALGTTAAAAAPIVYAAVAGTGGACPTVTETAPVPASVSRDCAHIGGSGPSHFGNSTLVARAQAGSVGAGARATSFGDYEGVQATAIGKAEALPIVFSWVGSGPAPTGPFTTSLNLELDGELGISTLNAASGVEVIFEVYVTGAGNWLYRYAQGGNDTVQYANNFAATTGIDGDGAMQRRVFDLDFTTPEFLVSLYTPLEVTLRLQTGVGAGRSIANVAYADFLNTGTFAEGRGVFNLPAGYTANAGNYIVNNRFVTGDGPGGNVPEPGGLALAGLALAALLGLRRRP